MTLTPKEAHRLHVLTFSPRPGAPNGVARGRGADIFTDPLGGHFH